MKLIYIVIDEFDLARRSGVSRKIAGKVEALSKLNKDTTLLSIKADDASSQNTTHQIANGIIEVRIGLKGQNRGRLGQIRSDKYFYSSLALWLKELNFDAAIFRYPGASFGLLGLVKQMPKKIFFEHNTIEYAELKLNEKKKAHVRPSLSPSWFLYWIQETKLAAWMEKALGGKILSLAGGGICVTEEIASYERSRAPLYRTVITGNGFDYESIGIPGTRSFRNGEKLILCLVVSSNHPWFGLDRIQRSVHATSANIEIWIAGLEQTEDNEDPRIKYMGYLSEEQLRDFYNGVHMAIAPMALYRKKLNYASALKVKESLAYGLPLLLGYKEQWISDVPHYSGYYLELPNDNSLIDFKQVYDFALRFYSEADQAIRVAETAKRDFSLEVIASKILDHIRTVTHAI